MCGSMFTSTPTKGEGEQGKGEGMKMLTIIVEQGDCYFEPNLTTWIMMNQQQH